MITHWKKYLFKVNEIYGDCMNHADLKKADINAYFQQTKPMQTNKRLSIHRQATHLCFDLEKSEEVLLREMNKSTRYEIRRARRDKITVNTIEHPKINDVKEFAMFYDSFAKAKGIQACKFNKLIALMESNMLVINYVSDEGENILAASANIANEGTAIGLYGASGRFMYKDISGQLISRANRYLQWCEMMYFKLLGFHTYNLMGLTSDRGDINHQKVNAYKKSYGGEERVIYQSFISQGLFGNFLILVLKILWKNNPDVIGHKELQMGSYEVFEKRKSV